MNRETISIKKVVNGGFGLGYLPSNQVVLVQFCLPGESVIVTTQESKKNYLFGKIAQIEKNHPARITPPCQYYGHCGGCDLQHAEYKTQVALKKDIVIDLLLRQDIISSEEINSIVKDVLPASCPLHYRQRVRLQVGDDGTLGFHRFRSNEIVGIDQCLLAQPSINSALAALTENESARELFELSTELELQQNPATDLISCIFHFKRKPRPTDFKRANHICAEITIIDRVFFKGEDFPITEPIGAEKGITDKMLTFRYEKIHGLGEGLQLSFETGGFCQVNLAQNRKMIETVLDLCDVSINDTVLDLYCGMGNFAIPLGSISASVHGIEGQGSSIRCAKKNSDTAGRENTTFSKQPVHRACEQLIAEKTTFDCVIIDPPRQGAPELAASLRKLCRKTLVYISCDPATLCRDLDKLVHQGFKVETVQPIDLFPQTHHIETVVLLKI